MDAITFVLLSRNVSFGLNNVNFIEGNIITFLPCCMFRDKAMALFNLCTNVNIFVTNGVSVFSVTFLE